MTNYTIQLHITADSKRDADIAAGLHMLGSHALANVDGMTPMPDSIDIEACGVTDDAIDADNKLNALFDVIVRCGSFEQLTAEDGPIQQFVCGEEDAPSKDELLAMLKLLFKDVL